MNEIRTTLLVAFVAAFALSPIEVDSHRVRRQGFAFPGQGGAGFPNFGGFGQGGFGQPEQGFQNQNNQGGGFNPNGFNPNQQQGFPNNQGGGGGFPQQQGGFPQQGGQQNQGFPQQNQGNQQQQGFPQQNNNNNQFNPNTNNNIAATTQRVIDLPNRPSTPAARTTIRPRQVQRCTEDCIPLTANPYNPVCGSDNTNYHNLERLECSRRCGVDVQFVMNGNCGSMRVVGGQGAPQPNNDQPQLNNNNNQFFG